MPDRTPLIAVLMILSAIAVLGWLGCGSKASHIGLRIDPSPTFHAIRHATQGSFSSAAQAAEYPDNFRDIRLEMRHIWRDLDETGRPPARDQHGHSIRSSAHFSVVWVYVEQAAAETIDRPYRQRIYRFRPLDMSSVWESTIYELPGDPLRFAGAHNDPSLLDELTPHDLIKRDGCEVILYHDSGQLGQWTITGGTVATRCASNWGGAAYTTSEVTITPNTMLTWDRGFAADGTQVWGSTKGPYRFERTGHPSDEHRE